MKTYSKDLKLKVLVPSLRPGQVMVLDNLGAHKGERVREPIEGRDCWLAFLAPYSPDFAHRGGIQQAQGAAEEGRQHRLSLWR